MKKKIFTPILILVVLFSAQQLKASGFSIFEIGARASAMAGAYVAYVDDVTAIYYNPAGLAFLEGIRVKTNILFSSLNTKAYQDMGLHHESNLLQIRGAHFFAWNLFNRLSIGIGLFNPYIAETSWIIENPYSYDTKFNIYTIRPALAVKLLNGLSIGFGVDIALTTLNWVHSLELWDGPYLLRQYRSYYELSGSGMGFVAGILWKIGTRFQLGGRYQHHVKSKLSGSNYTRGGLGLPFSYVNGNITLPAEFVLGLKFVPFNNFTLCLDFQRSRWSQTKGWQLQFDETQEHWNPEHGDFWEDLFEFSIDTANQNAELRLKDTWNVKFGLEYTVNDIFAFRAGYTHQPSAVFGGAIHPTYPDLDRKIITFGFGYEGPLFSIWKSDTSMSELSLDLFLQYVMTEAQASTLPGFEFTFDNDHFVIGIGLGFNF
ncbi:OmpP1/FadL family transporter [Acidobacteriota bacterium]